MAETARIASRLQCGLVVDLHPTDYELRLGVLQHKAERAMALSAGRGLVAEHELFRRGEEFWLDDRAGRDFTMYGQRIGYLGFGSIARETQRLLAPFAPEVLIHDPWLPDAVAEEAGAAKVSLFAPSLQRRRGNGRCKPAAEHGQTR